MHKSQESNKQNQLSKLNLQLEVKDKGREKHKNHEKHNLAGDEVQCKEGSPKLDIQTNVRIMCQIPSLYPSHHRCIVLLRIT